MTKRDNKTGFGAKFMPLLLAFAVTGPMLGSGSPALAEECDATHEVEITHVFEPGDVYVEVGDCVHFTNVHGIEHSAVGLEREFNTGILMPGGTALLRFDEPIAIPYVCGVHPVMTGVIIVDPKR